MLGYHVSRDGAGLSVLRLRRGGRHSETRLLLDPIPKLVKIMTLENEKLLLSTISGLLGVVRQHEVQISRLESALETLLDCPALDWKGTVTEVLKDLHEYDADGSRSSTVQSIDLAIESIRQASLKQV